MNIYNILNILNIFIINIINKLYKMNIKEIVYEKLSSNERYGKAKYLD